MALVPGFGLKLAKGTLSKKVVTQVCQQLANRLSERVSLIDYAASSRGKKLQPESELLAMLSERCGIADLAMFIPPLPRHKLLEALVHVVFCDSDLGAACREVGIVLICPRGRHPEGIQLSGGSFSNVLLRIDKGKAIVRKEVFKRETAPDLDIDLRLRFESAWLKQLRGPVVELFPSFIGTVHNERKYAYDMKFVPWPTLGELVFQGGVQATELSSILEHIYSVIQERMYCRSRISVQHMPEDNSYLSRIKRRTVTLLNSQCRSCLKRLLLLHEAPWIELNGRRCVTQRQLIVRLQAEDRWLPITHPRSGHLCHGDLILEDILVDPRDTSKFKLVDPNPLNQSVLFDISKTLMSLWLRYEFIYYDLFTLEHWKVESDGGIRLVIRLDESGTRIEETYDEAADRLVGFAKKNLRQVLRIDDAMFEAQLRMAAALQALAIPMFHLVHHGQMARAIAFTCFGLYHATRALTLADAT